MGGIPVSVLLPDHAKSVPCNLIARVSTNNIHYVIVCLKQRGGHLDSHRLAAITQFRFSSIFAPDLWTSNTRNNNIVALVLVIIEAQLQIHLFSIGWNNISL